MDNVDLKPGTRLRYTRLDHVRRRVIRSSGIFEGLTFSAKDGFVVSLSDNKGNKMSYPISDLRSVEFLDGDV